MRASVCLLGLAACGDLAPAASARICGIEVGEVPEFWTEWDEGSFEIATPQRMHGREWGGIDSAVGSWAGLDARVSYDLGAYSATLDSAAVRAEGWPVSDFEVCATTPPGSTRSAIWTGEDGTRRVGTHWAGPWSGRGDLDPDRLTVVVQLSELLPLERGLRILGSVRIKDHPTPWPGEMGFIRVDSASGRADTIRF